MYRLQFYDGSTYGCFHSFAEAYDECLRYGPEQCEIHVYVADYSIWTKTQSQPNERTEYNA